MAASVVAGESPCESEDATPKSDLASRSTAPGREQKGTKPRRSPFPSRSDFFSPRIEIHANCALRRTITRPDPPPDETRRRRFRCRNWGTRGRAWGEPTQARVLPDRIRSRRLRGGRAEPPGRWVSPPEVPVPIWSACGPSSQNRTKSELLQQLDLGRGKYFRSASLAIGRRGLAEHLLLRGRRSRRIRHL